MKLTTNYSDFIEHTNKHSEHETKRKSKHKACSWKATELPWASAEEEVKYKREESEYANNHNNKE